MTTPTDSRFFWIERQHIRNNAFCASLTIICKFRWIFSVLSFGRSRGFLPNEKHKEKLPKNNNSGNTRWNSLVKFFVHSNCSPSTVRVDSLPHRKWKEIKQEPSMLPGPAVPGCFWISLHFLWGKLSTRTVEYTCGSWGVFDRKENRSPIWREWPRNLRRQGDQTQFRYLCRIRWRVYCTFGFCPVFQSQD